jgi:hypothetical protein
MENRHDAANHLVARRKARLVVGPEGIVDHVYQAFVAVCARHLGTVPPALEDLQQVRVCDKRTRDRDGITRPVRDGLPDDGGSLESTGAQDRNPDRLLDGARVGQVDAFNLIATASLPAGLNFSGWKIMSGI